MLENIFIGTDIEKISRFENKTVEDDMKFLKKIFTEDEIKYCFSNKYPARHLTARFCAKEAITKTLYSADIKSIPYSKIEISHDKNKCPVVTIKGVSNIIVKVSLSTAILYVSK